MDGAAAFLHIAVVPVIVAVGNGFTVIVTPGLTPVNGLAQASLDVITHDTTCPFVNVVLVKVTLFVPTFDPSICHWYTGAVPPLTGTAVKVTLAPGQTLPLGDTVILTEGITCAVTNIVIKLEVAVVGFVHAPFEVRTQAITSLFAKVEFE